MKKAIFFVILFSLFFSFQGFCNTLRFYNTHTQETFFGCYKKEDRYLPEALKKINYVLRDHRTNTVHKIDPKLLDILFNLSRTLKVKDPCYHVISAYRTPQTNEMLRKKSRGVYYKSAHMEGHAIDIRVPGVPLKELRDKAISLKSGGVGYYSKANFIHVDNGKVKTWGC